jgi:putative transposase
MAQAVELVARNIGKGKSTVWDWLARYDEDPIGGLARKPRSDKSRPSEPASRFFDAHPEAAKFIGAKYLAEKNLTVRECYEALVREWKNPAEKLSKGTWDAPPSYKTVRVYLNHLPPVLRKTARKGDRYFNENFAPYLKTDFDSIIPNQIWVSDHRVFDVFVYNDCFPGQKFYRDMRLWVTIIIDMRSRLILGWAFSENPSSNSISSALHMAVRNYGLPKTFYCDNGKDFKKVGAEDAQSLAASGVLRALGVAMQYCLPGHPQSKLVESFFSGQSKRFDNMFLNAYAGCKPALRPEQCEELRREHKLYLEGKAKRTQLMPATEFIALAEQSIAEYNDKPHSGDGMNGRTPREVFRKGCPASSIHIPDMMQLAPLFWERNERVVAEGGTIRHLRHRYVPADAITAAELCVRMQNRDAKVVLACDPNDLREAVVLDLEGHVLGRVQMEELVPRDNSPLTRAMISESLRQRRAMLRVVKEYVAAVASGVPTELDYLRQRAGIAKTIEGSSPVLPPVAEATNGAAFGKPALAAPEYTADVVQQARIALLEGK